MKKSNHRLPNGSAVEKPLTKAEQKLALEKARKALRAAEKPARKIMGRPEFVPTDEQREKVKVLKAARMTDNQIAAALDICRPTLTKHFAFELEVGVAKVRAEVEMAMYRSALAGNVSAQRQILATLDALPPRPEKAAKEPKPVKLGKKEQILKDAEEATGQGEWGELLDDGGATLQ